MNPAPRREARVNPAPQNWFCVYLLRSKKNGRIYIVRLQNILSQGGAG